MRYLGNKTKLREHINNILNKYNIEGNIFCDLFTGTASVADYMKGKYSIIANDFMYYSYVIAYARLYNSRIPNFEAFNKQYKSNIFDWINIQSDNNLKEDGFIFQNYTPHANRMFFTEYNGKKIDTIRCKIEELKANNFIDTNEYFYLIASLLENVMSISNTSGTYEAFFKYWQSRAIPNFVFSPLEINEAEIVGNISVFNEDSNKCIRHLHGDILYLDTPYTVTQYASAYNILETIAKNDCPEIKGIAGKRGKGKCVSYYSYKNHALEQFEDLFRQADFRHILVSYSNQGVLNLDELIGLAKKFAKNGIVNVEFLNYQEYQNHRSSKKRKGEQLKEVILYFEKEISTIKSPLNYFGSKDTLFPQIQKLFPKHIGTFVDAMGGAFNIGVNVVATDCVIYNDINPLIKAIVEWLLQPNKENIIMYVENIILQNDLRKANKETYMRLRDKYNVSKNDYKLLYVLHMYAFQNLIRFNSEFCFNTPIGIAGYSEDIRKRIERFISRTPKIIFRNTSFKELLNMDFTPDTVFYFDPPYYISTAGYNDGKRGLEGWNLELEEQLLQVLLELHNRGFKFLLSNVIEHKGKKHQILIDWCNHNKFKIYPVGVSGWRYKKNEIIIKNY